MVISPRSLKSDGEYRCRSCLLMVGPPAPDLAEAIIMYRNRAHRLGVLLSSLAIMLVSHPTRAAIAGSGPGAPLASSFPGPLWELVTPAAGTAAGGDAD